MRPEINSIKKNKGFSLIEIIVAIAIMAIVVTPIMRSFITSAKVNKDSRKIMSASDCAQSIMEGFSDKSGSNLDNIANTAGNLVYENALTQIMEGAYNSSGNIKEITAPIGGLTQTTYTNSSEAEYYGIAKLYGQIMEQNIAAGNVGNGGVTLFKSRVECTDGSGGQLKKLAAASFFGFTNIVWENYRFDAIVLCVPVANTEMDQYFSYRVKLYLFDHNNFHDAVYDIGSKSYIISFDGGIKNK